jgi:hypothetical protein
MRRTVVLSCLCVVLLWATSPANAGVVTKTIREAVEFAVRKFGREVAEEGTERLAGKMMQLAARHGDDVVAAALKKIGPRAGKIATEAGEHGGVALRLLAKHGDDAVPLVTRAASLKAVAHYGDDAAVALLKHGQIGETLVERLGKEGVEALAKVTPQNGRRLAMMAADDGLKPELVSVVRRYGDEACEFIWRNKGALAVGATLTAFVASPEQFLNGTEKLASAVGEVAVRPLAELPKTIVSQINWTVLAIVAAIVFGVWASPREWKSRGLFWFVKQFLRVGRRTRRPHQ